MSPKMISARGPGLGMAESAVHRSMKAIVRRELERERFAVVEEPVVPPGRRVSWTAYRPDLLGYRSEGGKEEVVLVECETRPLMRRLEAKKCSTVWFQPRVYRGGSVRKILAVPQGRLHRVDMRIRRSWDIWVLGRDATMAKFPAVQESAACEPRFSKSIIEASD
ncbi:MAG: hypothetical protein JRM75_04310 [Nitrososphaerota archaeon]|nr:hypothetical protein [Nitrososphaerota archaeon]